MYRLATLSIGGYFLIHWQNIGLNLCIKLQLLLSFKTILIYIKVINFKITNYKITNRELGIELLDLMNLDLDLQTMQQ